MRFEGKSSLSANLDKISALQFDLMRKFKIEASFLAKKALINKYYLNSFDIIEYFQCIL